MIERVSFKGFIHFIVKHVQKVNKEKMYTVHNERIKQLAAPCTVLCIDWLSFI